MAGAALSLYWIDFNLYLSSLGLSTATIGVIATVASVAGAVIAFPASAASDRFGRRVVIGAGIGLGTVAIVGLLLTETPALIAVFAACWSMGWQAFQVVQAPFLTEHSDPDHRNELFAAQFAIEDRQIALQHERVAGDQDLPRAWTVTQCKGLSFIGAPGDPGMVKAAIKQISILVPFREIARLEAADLQQL